MPATNIYDLLPIPEEVKNPHPYQVFGIEDGEQDLAVISESTGADSRPLRASATTCRQLAPT